MVGEKGKYIFGVCKVGEKGQIVIPKDAGIIDTSSVEGGASGTGFDYIQEQTPENAKQGEIWFRLGGTGAKTFSIFILALKSLYLPGLGYLLPKYTLQSISFLHSFLS